jgi:RNA polymerase sigma-70 factor (ECF subfamily)
VAEIRAGVRVEEGFRQLIGLFLRPLQAFFSRRGFAPEDCADLTQETLLGIYRGIASFRDDSGFETWVFAIAANALRKRLRGRATAKRQAEETSLDAGAEGETREIAIPATDPAPEEAALRRERTARLRAAIAELPEQMRACVVLRVDRELAVQEIAVILGRSPETVKAHLFQARRKLRLALADDAPAGSATSRKEHD